MPRDDLTLYDGRGGRGKIVLTKYQDIAAILDEFSNRASNLPTAIAFIQEEIEQKDRQMAECLAITNKNESAIQKWIRLNGSHVPNPNEDQLSRIALENYDRAQVLQEEKLALAQRTQQIMDKHTRWLDGHIKALQDRGDFPNDLDIPSLL
jgi:inhibitor of growth protein 3